MATGLVITESGGKIFQGIQTKKQSKRQARALQAQAAFNREQAQLEREAAEFDATQQSRSFEKLMGRQRLGAAASGIRLEGSPLLLLDETLRDKEETITNIIAAGEARARALEFEAGQLGQQARDTKRAGRNALIGSIFGAAGSGLEGASKIKTFKT